MSASLGGMLGGRQAHPLLQPPGSRTDGFDSGGDGRVVTRQLSSAGYFDWRTTQPGGSAAWRVRRPAQAPAPAPAPPPPRRQRRPASTLLKDMERTAAARWHCADLKPADRPGGQGSRKRREDLPRARSASAAGRSLLEASLREEADPADLNYMSRSFAVGGKRRQGRGRRRSKSAAGSSRCRVDESAIHNLTVAANRNCRVGPGVYSLTRWPAAGPAAGGFEALGPTAGGRSAGVPLTAEGLANVHRLAAPRPKTAGGLTAAIPMENPYCSCKLTRVRRADVGRAAHVRAGRRAEEGGPVAAGRHVPAAGEEPPGQVLSGVHAL